MTKILYDAIRGSSGTADSIQLHASNQSVTFPGAVTITGAITSSTTSLGGVSSDSDKNTVAGDLAGSSLSGGESNTAFGEDALKDLVSNDHVTAVGYKAHENGTGGENVAVGSYAMGVGVTTGTKNVCVGNGAGKNLAGAEKNVYIGYQAGQTNTAGNTSVAVGYEAGDVHTNNDGTYIGYRAGYQITSGGGNTCLGKEAGQGLETGSYNTLLGLAAGKGQLSSSQDNNLYIARDNAAAGSAGVWVYGSNSGACTQGNNSSSWTTTSDQRLKKDITDNTVGLSVIDNVKVRNYKYKQYNKTREVLYTSSDTIPEGKQSGDVKTAESFSPVSSDDVIDMSEFPKADHVGQVALGQGNTAVQLGVIAQELEAVAPNCIVTSDKGVKTVDTDELFWHMLNAIKELSTKVKALEAG